MNSHATTIVRGPSVKDLIHSVQHTIHRAKAGILAAFQPAGHHTILWTGCPRVSSDCRVVRASGLDLAAALDAARHGAEIVWAFPDGEGAEARLYGRLELRMESAPELDDVVLPLELTARIVCLSLEVPSHGISMMAPVPQTARCFGMPALRLSSAKSLQENVTACLLAAKWDWRGD